MVSPGLRVEFRVQPTTELDAIQSATKGDTVELDNAIYAGDEQWYQHLTVSSEMEMAALRDRLSNDAVSDLVSLSSVGFDDTTYYLLALVEQPNPFIVTTVTEAAAIPHRVRLANEQLTVTASVEDWAHLKEVADHLETHYRGFELLSTSQVETVGIPLGANQVKHAVRGKVTESQLDLLATAYQHGYFDVPQEVTSKELAETVGTSQSTLSERLRNAQYALLEVLFGSR